MPRNSIYFVVLITLLLGGCREQAKLSEAEGSGPQPKIPAPTRSWIPTVNIAVAKGWPEGATPKAASGLGVEAFAKGLDHPRWLYVLPNGDVLVAESNAPTRPKDNPGLKNWAMGLIKSRAGAGVKSADRITLLRDSDGTGHATKTTFLTGLNAPIGMALVGSDLYVANTDAILRFPYKEGQTSISEPGVKVADLPAGEINHHWTKNILASPDGRFLYATVGSNSNVAENGIENEERRAAILQVDLSNGKSRVFASGLRNPVGMGWEPKTGALWTVVNERDELGSDLVPDYLTSVKEGGFMAGPTAISAGTSMIGSNLRSPISWRRQSCPTTRWGRIPHRSVSILQCQAVARALCRWRIHWSAWVLEPDTAQRL